MLAQSLCDGAHGTNQALPPIPIDELPVRYRRIVEAILFGTASLPNRRGRAAERRAGEGVSMPVLAPSPGLSL